MATRNEPYALINQIQRDMNRMFDRRGGVPTAESDDASYGEAEWLPAVDIKEEPNQWVLHADLPGVDPSTVEITVDKNVLRIKGVRSAQNEAEDEGYRRRERVSGTFFRQFTLTDEVDKDAIQARSSHGVLEINIPKAAVAQPRQIAVET